MIQIFPLNIPIIKIEINDLGNEEINVKNTL